MANVELSAEDINRILVEAVANSAIGQAIRTTVDKVLEDLKKSYQNPFESHIRNVIAANIDVIVRDEFGPAIREQCAERVRATLTNEVVDSLISKAVIAATRALAERNY